MMFSDLNIIVSFVPFNRLDIKKYNQSLTQKYLDYHY